MRCNTLAAAGKAEALLRRRLDAHARNRDRERPGDVCAHLFAVWGELGRLREHRRVEVDDLKACGSQMQPDAL